MGFEDLICLFCVVDNQAQDAEIGGVGQRGGTDVHARVGEKSCHVRQAARAVLDEHGDLFDLHASLLRRASGRRGTS